MRNKIRNSLLFLLTGILILQASAAVFADSSSNYIFGSGSSLNRNAPIAYEVEKVYHARDLEGVDNLDDLQNMFITDDSIYVSKRGAIIVLDYDFKTKHILSEYTDLEGNEAKIASPDGLFVTDDGLLYVCEPTKERILVFNQDYELVNSFGKPKDLDLDNRYQPTRVVVDSLNRMYVIATGVYDGIMEISQENKFQRYFGTTTISVSVLDIFFRMLASEAQLSRQALLLPTEYSSMTINEKGFLYTTIRSTDVENPVRLLNVNGDNILPESWDGETPVGDFGEKSTLSYIDCNEYGMFMVLDDTFNRIFTYDESSNLLFVFGGKGDKDGCFLYPVSIRWLGDSNRVLVADKTAHSITVMKPTNYASAIFEAVRLEKEGDRVAAKEYWQKALDMNNNLNMAKDALGRELYWEGDYEGSQKLLKEIYRKDYYSKSFEKHREKLIRTYAPAVVIGLAVLIAAVIIFRRVRRVRKGGGGNAS